MRHTGLPLKAQVHSVLDEIPGVGEKRRRALMKAFSSIEELKGADAQTISERALLPLNVAEGIYSFLHK